MAYTHCIVQVPDLRKWNTNTDAHANTDCNTHADSDAHADADANTYANADTSAVAKRTKQSNRNGCVHESD